MNSPAQINRKNYIDHVVAIISLAFLTLFTFSPSIKKTFLTWDDPMSLDYSLIHSLSWEGIKHIFTTIVNTTYIPLTILSFAIEHHFFKYNFLIYHLTNVVLHIGVAILAYLFVIRLGVRNAVAFLRVRLFAIHPMKVESVSWITERKDVLYSVFYLGALHTYLSYIKRREKRSYTLTFVLGLFSMLAKPMALSLPLILLLCDWYFERRDVKKCFLEKLPFFAYILPLAYITYSQNHNAVAIEQNAFQAILIFIWTYSFYFIKFLFPIVLVPLYAVPEPIDLTNPSYLLAFLVGGGSLILINHWKKNRLIVFCFMFHLASIFFFLRFNRIENQHVVADRFIYLSSLALCLIAMIKFDEKVLQNAAVKGYGYLLYTLVVLLLLIKCVLQQNVWQNDITFWSHIIKYEPQIGISYNNRGFSYLEQKRYDLAEVDFKKAIDIIPNYAYAYSNLGMVYYAQKDYRRAIDNLNAALQIDPTHGKSYNALGIIYEELGQPNLALLKYNEAIQNNPTEVEYYFNRAHALRKQGKMAEAISDLKTVIKLSPNKVYPYITLGDIYTEQSNFPLAIETYQRALAVDPNISSIHHNLGIVLASQNKLTQAADEITRAIEFDSNNGLYFLNRSKIYLKKNDYVKAVADAQKAQDLGLPEAKEFLKDLQRQKHAP